MNSSENLVFFANGASAFVVFITVGRWSGASGNTDTCHVAHGQVHAKFMHRRPWKLITRLRRSLMSVTLKYLTVNALTKHTATVIFVHVRPGVYFKQSSTLAE